VEKNALYRCLDKLLEHKAALFDHLRQRWQDLFGASFEVLLYALSDQVNHFLAFLSHLSTSRPQLHAGSVAALGLVA
jgi:hypothetical protein